MILEHLDKQTADGTAQNLDALYKLFPSCFTESADVWGKVKRTVNWGKLRELLGDNVADGEPEVYDFTWVGKRAAQREAMAPIRKTLRPCPEESVNWDTTQNLYIEGDNLEVLKLLQNSYMGKVKMIYIDPPYNTGNDFVYHDNFSQSVEEYDEHNHDDEGIRFRRNTDSNGRFHSDWCSMIYSRLMVARTLLKEDGVIFISIDDNEQRNLKNICDEVFYETNYINTISISTKNTAGASGGGEDKRLKKNIEYILIYAKNYNVFNGFNKVYVYKELSDLIEQYKEEGSSWKYTSVLVSPGTKTYICSTIDGDGNEIKVFKRINPIIKSVNQLAREENLIEKEIYKKYGPLIFQTTNAQTSIRDRIIETRKENNIVEDLLSIEYIPRSGKNKGKIYEQFYKGDKCRLFVWLRDTSEEIDGVLFKRDNLGTLWDVVGETKNLTKEGGVAFPNGKKPLYLISKLCQMQSTDDDIVMDFFSGSSTTAHAVIKNNSEDGKKRRFIMVQLPENVDEDSIEANNGEFNNICEIGKERIRRAGKKIKEDSPLTTQDLDIGFRVFKCDESNYKNVAFTPSDYSQESLELFVDNIKEDRTDLDLLFDCMLRWGITLDLPMTSTKVDGCKIHNVNEGALVACFEGRVTEAVIDAICAMEPNKVVFRDSSFEEAAQKMNLFELFKQKLGWEEQEVRNNVKVI